MRTKRMASDSRIPNNLPPRPEASYRQALSAYVNKVESILRREQGQWGQLVSEIELFPLDGQND